MLRGLYTGWTSMVATWNQTDVIANNLANVNTTGFKRDDVTFAEYRAMAIRRVDDDVTEIPLGLIDRRPPVGKLGTGVRIEEIFTDFNPGTLRATEGQLDVALDGQGFFTVETPQGVRYTRDGNFQVNRQGYLVDKNGNPVQGLLLNNQLGPIQLTDANVSIDREGRVYEGDPRQGEQVEIAQLRLAGFAQPRALKKIGDNYWEAPAGVQPQALPADSAVRQGYLEQSNVNIVQEMVRMIEANRLFGIEEKVITTADTLAGKVINDLPRTS